MKTASTFEPWLQLLDEDRRQIVDALRKVIAQVAQAWVNAPDSVAQLHPRRVQ